MSYTSGPNSLLNVFTGDSEVEALFSAKADLEAMLAFERALVTAQAALGILPEAHAQAITSKLDEFQIDMEALRADFRNDGVAPPSLVRQFRNTLAEEMRASFHRGATSQDLIDSSLMMRLRKAVAIADARLEKLNKALDTLKARSADGQILTARTRMQNALPISVGEKIGNWQSQLANLKRGKPDYFPVQLGGPEGAARAFGQPYDAVCKALADALDLNAPAHHWHTDRQPLAAIAFWFASVATAMGKIAQDILIMAQTDIAEINLATGGSSSAMPHKKNPILAEIVVAQARYCHTQMAGLQTASIHENERSGAAWTLEWMVLPPLVAASSSSITNMLELVQGAEFQAP